MIFFKDQIFKKKFASPAGQKIEKIGQYLALINSHEPNSLNYLDRILRYCRWTSKEHNYLEWFNRNSFRYPEKKWDAAATVL